MIRFNYLTFTKFSLTIFFIITIINADDKKIKNQDNLPAESNQTNKQEIQSKKKAKPYIINDIIVIGNKYVPQEAILNVVPDELQKGREYDPFYTSTLIRNIFHINYFKQVEILGEELEEQRMNLYIAVEEKKRLENVVFKGNKNLTEEAIKKKIPFNIPSIDKVELQKYANKIKRLYFEKDYHLVEITPELQETGDTATAIFNIKENLRSFIKRVFFKGNHHFNSKTLRKIIFTREDWLLSFIDKAGTYQPEAVEMDKHQIENFYQNHGYIMAKVSNAAVVMDEKTKHYQVTFTLEEGDQYTIGQVNVEPHENLTENMLLNRILVKPGMIYSREKLTKSIEILRLIWGEFGYAFADIIPSVQPDAQNKTVNISFRSELGEKVYLNRLNIKGNRKTRDKIVRRQLLLDEGDLITNKKMDESKDQTELLGYFDKKDGVNWKITRIDENLADLDLMVKEVKTGRASLEMGINPFGPRGIKSTNSSFTVSGHLSQMNLFGLGLLANLQGSVSREEQTAMFSIADPWLFDIPLFGGVDFSYSRTRYEEIKDTQNDVMERIVGGSVTTGYYTPLLWFGPTTIRFQVSAENRNIKVPTASHYLKPEEQLEYQGILNRRFFTGNLGKFQFGLSQDARNHPQHPTRGYQWGFFTKFGASEHADREINGELVSCAFGFVRGEFNISWYTPLIDENRLYLCMRGTAGFVRPISKRDIPFSELYSLGGPNSIRGFEPTQVSPRWRGSNSFGTGNSIGGTNAFSWTAELIFPITEDFSAKGYVFYDGGACWKAPDTSLIAQERLFNNKFFYRHSVGIGVRLLKPTPITIDWGFKLNPQKKLGEQLSEIHFSMSREF